MPRISRRRLRRISRNWNRRIPYRNYEGPRRSLLEAIRQGGKCHNYVEAKGRRLQGLGVPIDQLEVGIGYTAGADRENHSVLIYRDLVLDNRNNKVRPVSKVDGVTMRITDRLPFETFFS